MSTHPHTTNTALGLWVYIMSDCVLFASLFATYAVLHTEVAAGPSTALLFDMRIVLAETLILLTSSFTCGLAVWAAREKRLRTTWVMLLSTLLLGGLFIGLELREFGALFAEGYSWHTSAFLSSFFTLVGMHGLHVALGLLWLVVLGAHLLMRGLTHKTERGIFYFSLFWHFLDIVWICIFSFVYLFGMLSL